MLEIDWESVVSETVPEKGCEWNLLAFRAGIVKTRVEQNEQKTFSVFVKNFLTAQIFFAGLTYGKIAGKVVAS